MYYLGVEDDGYPRGLNDQDLAGWSHLVYSVALQVRQHSSCRAAAACGEPELASPVAPSIAPTSHCLSSTFQAHGKACRQPAFRQSMQLNQHASLQLRKGLIVFGMMVFGGLCCSHPGQPGCHG